MPAATRALCIGPGRNVVHHFKPVRKTIDVALAATPNAFELLNETKLVLGRHAKA